MEKSEFIERAAKGYKLRLLRQRQRELGSDIMDEFAVRLNCEPTYDERKHVESMWDLFEELGAKHP